MRSIPVAWYIHFPWCIRKCPYCDFNSHAINGGIDTQRYLRALRADIGHTATQLDGRTIQSIFLGGGTPSLFSGDEIKTVLTCLSHQADVARDAEITLEANPGRLEADAFDAYLEAGVNRLSLGVQSFNNRSLQALGRVHDAANAHTALHNARLAGFTNLNLDLMFALPHQTIAEAMQDCDTAIECATAHLSYYQLTIEPNTWFARFPPQCPDSDQQYAMQEAIANRLQAAGYLRYEVSAYARPGMACRHNLNYWNFGDYLGVGAGAHSKWSTADAVYRCWKEKHPPTYMARIEAGQAVSHPTAVSGDNILFEFMLNALRLKDGFRFADFTRTTGLAASVARAALAPFRQCNWVEFNATGARCSDTGYWFIDEIVQSLLPDPSPAPRRDPTV